MSVAAEPHHYHAKISWTGAQQGPTSSYEAYSREYIVEIDRKPRLVGSSDAAFRGDPRLHNPEDLLVVALSTCHMLSFLAIASRRVLLVTAYEDEATGTMTLKDGRVRFTDVLLRPRVTVAPGSDLAFAERAHEQAHSQCFIANSVNFPVRHEATILVGPQTPG